MYARKQYHHVTDYMCIAAEFDFFPSSLFFPEKHFSSIFLFVFSELFYSWEIDVTCLNFYTDNLIATVEIDRVIR